MSTADQTMSLVGLWEAAISPTPGYCNFGVMLLMESKDDIPFLAPIAPELRGVEIVSRDGKRDFDIWRRERRSEPQMLLTNLTAAEVINWLQIQCHHTEAEYRAKGAVWAEDVFIFYGIPKKPPTEE